jgi:hypothetical protein
MRCWKVFGSDRIASSTPPPPRRRLHARCDGACRSTLRHTQLQELSTTPRAFYSIGIVADHQAALQQNRLPGAMWQIGHTARQSRPLPKRCPSRGAMTTLDVVQELFGGAMSDPSATTCRFNVGNNRRVRLRIEAAAMRAVRSRVARGRGSEGMLRATAVERPHQADAPRPLPLIP